jgi:hypothetical protein
MEKVMAFFKYLPSGTEENYDTPQTTGLWPEIRTRDLQIVKPDS